MKISVIGSGYVGTTTSALFAMAGHSVTAIDIDASIVENLNNGKAHFYEAGLNELISFGVANGSLKASTSYDSVEDANVVFSCVGTPDNPDGSPNITYIDEVANIASKKAPQDCIFVQKSTVPVGTGQRLQKLMPQLIYASNPEFLKEGTAIEDNLFYDRIVIGCEDNEASKKIEKLFLSVNQRAEEINKIANLNLENEALTNHRGQTILTNINSAELIKVTANAFLALKISFANTTAKLADRSGADIIEVMNGVGADRRIGKAFFNAGRGYGGGCFPKDVSGLISVAIDHGVDFGIMTAATDLNASMPGYIVSKVADQIDLKGEKVGVLGLSFKAGTSDARKSPAVAVANLLAREGAHVTAYDPQANEEAKSELNRDIGISNSGKEALSGAKAVFIATNWPEFTDMKAQDFGQLMSGTIIVDCMNSLNKADLEAGGLTYIGVGR